MTGRWRDNRPKDLRDMLPPGNITWALAGGYALEAALPGHTREHSDIEVACFRSALPALLDQLPDFEIAVAHNKQLIPLDRRGPLPPPQFSLWLRTRGEQLWDFEILIEDHDGDDWVYRRAPEIRRSASSVFMPPPQARGPWIIAPEVQQVVLGAAAGQIVEHLVDRAIGADGRQFLHVIDIEVGDAPAQDLAGCFQVIEGADRLF